jgi:hypothetical protein
LISVPPPAPRNLSRSASAPRKFARSEASCSSSDPVFARSSARISESWRTCAVSRFKIVSLPVISWLRKNCASMKTDSRNTNTSSSVAKASTKPGQ